jgi:hypothetical protein
MTKIRRQYRNLIEKCLGIKIEEEGISYMELIILMGLVVILFSVIFPLLKNIENKTANLVEQTQRLQAALNNRSNVGILETISTGAGYTVRDDLVSGKLQAIKNIITDSNFQACAQFHEVQTSDSTPPSGWNITETTSSTDCLDPLPSSLTVGIRATAGAIASGSIKPANAYVFSAYLILDNEPVGANLFSAAGAVQPADAIPSSSPSPGASATPSTSISASASVTPTASISVTPSTPASATSSPSASISVSASSTPSRTPSPSTSVSATASPSASEPPVSPSVSVTPSVAESPSATASISASSTTSASATSSPNVSPSPYDTSCCVPTHAEPPLPPWGCNLPEPPDPNLCCECNFDPPYGGPPYADSCCNIASPSVSPSSNSSASSTPSISVTPTTSPVAASPSSTPSTSVTPSRTPSASSSSSGGGPGAG